MTKPSELHFGAPSGQGSIDCLLGDATSVVRALIDTIAGRVLVLDENDNFVYANHEFWTFTGIQPAQLLGANVSKSAAFGRYVGVRHRLDAGESVTWEGWIAPEEWVDPRGYKPTYVREYLIPIGIRVGASRSATVVIRHDLTDLKLKEAELTAKVKELESTEALKAAIVDYALAGLVSTDADGRIVDFNPAAEAMFGHPRQEVLGHLVADVIIPPRHREAHRHGMARLQQGEAPRMLGKRLELAALRADGSEFPVEMVLWRTEVNGIAHFTASLTDLSDRQRAAAEIARQRDALRQGEKLTAMGSLLAGVAHELNNPLAIVSGRASLLEEKTLGTPLHNDARRIREAAERCGRIVRTFLNMARQRPSQRSSVALNELVAAALDMLQYELRTHGVSVVTQFAADLPTINADADQIGQIVLNLLVNAQQALSPLAGPRQLTVSTSVYQPDGGGETQVWLRLADNGRGVSPELREKIFDPYFTTKPEGVGTGLGLSVSRTLAREHGGDLVLETSEVGASMRLSLPLGGHAQPAQSSAEAPSGSLGSEGRILVVDDEAEIAELIREFLESAGYEVATAGSGNEALELLAEAQFDAVVSDLRMPDMDGSALWRAVSQRHPRLAKRMVFVTGDTLGPQTRSFLAETGCASLDKPFSRADLLHALKHLKPN